MVWGRTIQHLSIEWSINDQYAYGWGVPALCLLMLWRRRGQFALSDYRFPLSLFCLIPVFVFIRWIGEANPDWRLVSAGLGASAVAITLVIVAALAPASWRFVAIPILLFLTAVPWPTFVEHPLVQWLTRGSVAVTTEVLSLIGTPAIAHGNIIETAAGTVDVDEACSGIRSLQVSLMLGLFFGEWNRFSGRHRALLVGAAMGFAWFFNLCRTLLLSVITSQSGPAAAGRWHDPAGVAILLGCFCCIWWLAGWLARGAVPAPDQPAATPAPIDLPAPGPGPRPWLILAAPALLLAGEVAIAVWYFRPGEIQTPSWQVNLPRELPSFRASTVPDKSRKILRFDEAQAGHWIEQDGTRWQAVFLRWNPGGVAVHLARNHTPDICLPAAGRRVSETLNLAPIAAAGTFIPFRCYTAVQEAGPVFLFYTLWEDGARVQKADSGSLTWANRWLSVIGRRRNPGQRVLHVGIAGARDRVHAEQLLRERLPALLRSAS